MEYSIKPEKHELEQAKRVVEESMEKSRAVLSKEENVEVYLAGDGREFVEEEMNGAQGRTPSSKIIQASFCPEVDGWRKTLKKTVAHEYAHAWFYEKRSQSSFLWGWILEEALTQNFAEKIYPGIESPWSEKFSKEEISERWSEVKEALDDEIDRYTHPLFFGGEEFPRWLGYSLSYLIGKKLLEEHDLEDFPDLKKSDLLEAGEELFGEGK